MNSLYGLLPDNTHISVSSMCDNALLDTGIEAAVLNHMRQNLADFIVNARLERKRGEWATTFRLDLLCFSPDQFANIVHQAAERLLMLRSINQCSIPSPRSPSTTSSPTSTSGSKTFASSESTTPPNSLSTKESQTSAPAPRKSRRTKATAPTVSPTSSRS